MRTSVFRKVVSVLCLFAILCGVFCTAAFAAYENTYVNTGDQIADLIGVARTQVGYAENGAGETKYGAYLNNSAMDWCAAFIAWCANEAGLSTFVIPKTGSSNTMKAFFETRGVYFPSPAHGGSYTPKAGDIVFVSATNSPANVTHVGIVAAVENGTVKTIEGNYSNKVSEVSYPLDTAKIVAYGAPKYTTSNYRTGYYTANTDTALRSTANSVSTGNVLLTVPKDTTVRVSAINGSWGYAYYGGRYGWIDLDACAYRRALETEYTPAPLPENALYKVADVSKFNVPENIDWKKMREDGVQAVILRIAGRGYGLDKTLYRDTAFAEHYKNATAAGLAVGVYFFSYALDASKAKEEAELTIKILKENDCKLAMPVFIDIEEYSAGGVLDRQHERAGKAACSTVVNTFCDVIEDAGYYPGVYCNKSFAETLLEPSVFTGRAVWIAHYAVTCGYTGRLDMWQYTDRGRVAGYSGNIDLSYCYVDFPSIIGEKAAGYFNEHVPEEEFTVTKEATCSEQGTQIKACVDCGITLISEALPFAKHTNSTKCVLPKNTSVKAGDVLSDATVKSLIPESDPKYKTVYYPQYESDGGALLTYCVDCQKVTSVQYSYGKTPHNKKNTQTVAATCTKEGIRREICTDCKKTLSETLLGYAAHVNGQTVIENTSCTADGKRNTLCAVCGTVLRSAYIAPQTHSFDQGVTVRPTLEKDGGTTYTCSKCGTKETIVIPAPMYADADGNKKITAEDARLALRAAVSLDRLTIAGSVAADTDNNGKVNSVDARNILRFAVKLENADELMKKYYP